MKYGNIVSCSSVQRDLFFLFDKMLYCEEKIEKAITVQIIYKYMILIMNVMQKKRESERA